MLNMKHKICVNFINLHKKIPDLQETNMILLKHSVVFTHYDNKISVFEIINHI